MINCLRTPVGDWKLFMGLIIFAYMIILVSILDGESLGCLAYFIRGTHVETSGEELSLREPRGRSNAP